MKARMNEYVLNSDKLSNSFDIISISDIHSNVIALKSLKSLLIKSKYLFICGDVLDSVNNPNQDILLKELKSLSDYTNIILTLGNHDIVEKNRYGLKYSEIEAYVTYFFDELKKDMVVLSEKINYLSLNKDISVGAINMSYEWYKGHEHPKSFNKVLNSWSIKIDDNKFNILLSHSPNALICDNKLCLTSVKKPNLILCGHNHGGLTPQFIQDKSKKHIGIVGPYANIFKENAFGFWTTDSSSLVLSNGITKVSSSSELFFISNLLNSIYIPDIELIHLNPGKNHSLSLVKRTIHKF